MVTFTNEPVLFVCFIVVALSMAGAYFFGAQVFAQQRPTFPPAPKPNMCHAGRVPTETEEWHTYRHKFNVCGCAPIDQR